MDHWSWYGRCNVTWTNDPHFTSFHIRSNNRMHRMQLDIGHMVHRSLHEIHHISQLLSSLCIHCCVPARASGASVLLQSIGEVGKIQIVPSWPLRWYSGGQSTDNMVCHTHPSRYSIVLIGMYRWDTYLPLTERHALPAGMYDSKDPGSVLTPLRSPIQYDSDFGASRKRHHAEDDSMLSDMDSEFWGIIWS